MGLLEAIVVRRNFLAIPANVEKEAKDAAANAANSLLKTKIPSLATKKDAVSPTKNAVVERKTTYPTNGFSQLPTVQPAPKSSLDYYRNGKAAGSKAAYAIQPRNITEFGEKNSFSANDEPASIRLVGKLNKGGVSQDQDLLPPFTKFFLESVSEAHNERSQIVETFGDFYVFFFGERPPIYTYSGTFVNTQDVNWTQDFMVYYDKFLRGTKSVEYNARIVMTYGGRSIEGFILNVSTQTSAMSQNATAFSFQVLILDRKVMQLSRDFGLVTADNRFNNSAGFNNLLATVGLSKPNVSKAFNAVKDVMDNKVNPSTMKMLPASDQVAILSGEYETPLIASADGKITKGPF